MPDYTVASPVNTFLRSADQAAMRSALALAAGYDLLSTLVNSPVSITADGALVVSKMNVVSGSAAFTGTLPDASTADGKLIGVLISNSYAFLFTLATLGESISPGGGTSRIMWAGEVAICLSDGIEWKKVTGLSIPMTSICRYGTGSVNQYSYTSGSSLPFPVDTATSDPAGLLSVPDSAIKIARPGNYQLVISYSAGDTLSGTGFWNLAWAKNGTAMSPSVLSPSLSYNAGSNYIVVDQLVLFAVFAVGDLVQGAYFTSEAGKHSRVADGQEPTVQIKESAPW